jgi:hypothetical protein
MRRAFVPSVFEFKPVVLVITPSRSVPEEAGNPLCGFARFGSFKALTASARKSSRVVSVKGSLKLRPAARFNWMKPGPRRSLRD